MHIPLQLNFPVKLIKTCASRCNTLGQEKSRDTPKMSCRCSYQNKICFIYSFRQFLQLVDFGNGLKLFRKNSPTERTFSTTRISFVVFVNLEMFMNLDRCNITHQRSEKPPFVSYGLFSLFSARMNVLYCFPNQRLGQTVALFNDKKKIKSHIGNII
ncbi:hypothetical protein FKM82_010088 [Ascaphus truei]